MAFEYENSQGRKYYLHKKTGKGTLFYFSRSKAANACELPVGYKIIEHPTTKMPMLKRK